MINFTGRMDWIIFEHKLQFYHLARICPRGVVRLTRWILNPKIEGSKPSGDANL